MNGEDTDLERLRRAFAAAASGARARDDCPSPDRLWEALSGALPPEDTRALVSHCASCAACAEDWRLGRELAAPVPWLERERERRRSWWGGWPGVAAAAAAVFLASAIALREPAVPTDRGAMPLVRSLVPEDRPQPRSRLVLRWTPVGEDARYDVRVADETLSTLAHARALAVPELVVPADTLKPVPPGGLVLWQVEAVLPDGTRVPSTTFMTRLE